MKPVPQSADASVLSCTVSKLSESLQGRVPAANKQPRQQISSLLQVCRRTRDFIQPVTTPANSNRKRKPVSGWLRRGRQGRRFQSAIHRNALPWDPRNSFLANHAMPTAVQHSCSELRGSPNTRANILVPCEPSCHSGLTCSGGRMKWRGTGPRPLKQCADHTTRVNGRSDSFWHHVAAAKTLIPTESSIQRGG